MSSSFLYPFTAIVGQEQLKLALILNAVDPAIGGVLISGEKGTAKSTAVRGLASLSGRKTIEIPLNVTEDRLVGTLDLADAVNGGDKHFESGLLYDTINRAKTCYFENRASWDDMVIRDMNKDVSWEKSAKQYKDMYVGLTPRD